MTAPVDRRSELVALWRALAARGASVTWHDVAALPDDVVEALCAAEARRIRALVEGEASGWMPGRHALPPATRLPLATQPIAALP